MRILPLSLILAATLGVTAPAMAQSAEDIISGIAKSLIAQELDKTAYIAAQNANTVTAYRNYLAQYPKGIYRANAERALARLGAPVEDTTTPPVVDEGTASAATIEARLGVTFSQRVAVQRELTRLGYSTGGADGVWGRNTRSAIGAWQRGTGQSGTGYLTEAQLRVLLQGGSVVVPDVGTPTAAQVEAALGLTRSQRITIQQQLASVGYSSGVADGLWGSRTRTAISNWQKANKQPVTGYVTSAQVRLIAQQAAPDVGVTPPVDDGANAALEESLLGLTLAERADIQRRLTRLGYSTFGADGVFGRNTRAAIAGWQRDEAVAVTGFLTADQVRLLRVQTGG